MNKSDADGVFYGFGFTMTWYGIGPGGTIKVKSNIDIFGKLYASTPVDSFGDAFSVSGNIGVGISW